MASPAKDNSNSARGSLNSIQGCQDSHKQLVDEDGEVDDANKLDPSLTRSKLQGTEQRAGQLFNPFDDNQVASVTGSPPNPAQPKQLMLPPPPRLPVSPGQPMLPAVRPPRPTRPPKRFRPPTGAQPDSAWAGLQAFAPEARCVTKPRRAKRPPTIFRAPTGAQPESTWADLQAFALTARR
ncbi:hypothetical protein ABBQ38_005736 [Trebouxia sp. C0009 RCD-2024]